MTLHVGYGISPGQALTMLVMARNELNRHRADNEALDPWISGWVQSFDTKVAAAGGASLLSGDSLEGDDETLGLWFLIPAAAEATAVALGTTELAFLASAAIVACAGIAQLIVDPNVTVSVETVDTTSGPVITPTSAADLQSRTAARVSQVGGEPQGPQAPTRWVSRTTLMKGALFAGGAYYILGPEVIKDLVKCPLRAGLIYAAAGLVAGYVIK